MCYTTRDLYLASTIMALGGNLLNTTFQIEGSKSLAVGYFSFPDSPELQETIRKYNAGDLLVEPKSFIVQMRSLKATISNFQKNPFKNQPSTTHEESNGSNLSPT